MKIPPQNIDSPRLPEYQVSICNPEWLSNFDDITFYKSGSFYIPSYTTMYHLVTLCDTIICMSSCNTV